MHVQPTAETFAWNGPICPTHGRYLGVCVGCFPALARPEVRDRYRRTLARAGLLHPKLHDEGAGL